MCYFYYDVRSMASEAQNYVPGEYFHRMAQERSRPEISEIEEERYEDEESVKHSREFENINVNEEYAQNFEGAKTVNSKRKAPAQNPAKNKRPKKFAWTTEKIEDLLKYMRNYKSNCDFNGIDFEADLACMYTEIRKCMARDYSSDFGPEQATIPDIEIKDMDKEHYNKYIKENEAEKVLMKNGYSRTKEKIKALRQDYHNAVKRDAKRERTHCPGALRGSGRNLRRITSYYSVIVWR